jgi:hypothetical protein
VGGELRLRVVHDDSCPALRGVVSTERNSCHAKLKPDRARFVVSRVVDLLDPFTPPYPVLILVSRRR